MTSIEKVEKNFHNLIREFISEKYIDIYEFPKLSGESAKLSGYTAVPGMYGGFKYRLKMEDGKPVLYVNAASRMDYYEEFIIDEDSCRPVEIETIRG